MYILLELLKNSRWPQREWKHRALDCDGDVPASEVFEVATFVRVMCLSPDAVNDNCMRERGVRCRPRPKHYCPHGSGSGCAGGQFWHFHQRGFRAVAEHHKTTKSADTPWDAVFKVQGLFFFG